jgi:hypothetical protein
MPTSLQLSSSCASPSPAQSSDSSGFIAVTIEVPVNHPLLQLKRGLPWPQLEQTCAWHWREAGKNVDGGQGRPFDVALYTRILVLMLLLRLKVRELERELKENAAARLFVEIEDPTESLVRDHSNLARTFRALGVEGLEALNALVLRRAEEHSFVDPDVLSSDTTAQELPIGYPNEPGILRQVAQRAERLLLRLKKAGMGIGEALLEPGRKLLKLVREHRLFAKTLEEKHEVLERIVEQGQQLAAVAASVRAPLIGGDENFFNRVSAKLDSLRDFIERLTPQIRYWMATGKVAAGKLLHPALQAARAIVRNKIGKKCEFGLPWLICRLGGGYVFGKMLLKTPAESKMPLEAVTLYQRIFGAGRVPKAAIYDRGGWAAKTIEKLRGMGIDKIGIVPKGRAAWLVEEADQAMVKTHRAQTEAVIGTLKSEFYGFNRPKQRSTRMVEQAAHGSFVSVNLNRFLKDLLKQNSSE